MQSSQNVQEQSIIGINGIPIIISHELLLTHLYNDRISSNLDGGILSKKNPRYDSPKTLNCQTWRKMFKK